MVKNLFMKLVSHTTPNGFEFLVYDSIPHAKIDDFGNRYVIIGDGPHKHLFTCHLDTFPLTSFSEEITMIEDGDIIRTDGRTLLGADDKAGMTVLLTMIEAGIPGIYGFFLAEEIGLLGSDFATHEQEWKELLTHVKAVISFDRKGTSSIITHQGGKRTCSKRYADQLSTAFHEHGLSLKPDNTGSATDSLSFYRMDKRLQCTNISVGYEQAHTVNEYQNIAYLERLCNAVTHMQWPIP